MSKADKIADKEQQQATAGKDNRSRKEQRAERKTEHKEQRTERKAARRAKRTERKAARKARRAERRARRRERRAYWKEWRQSDYQASREKALAANGQGVMMLSNIKVPPYIYSTRSQLLIISFTTIFALLFINIYTPFNSYTWAPMNDTLYFVSSTMVVGGGMVLVILSRVFMNLFARKHGIYYWLYIVWIICEIGLMAIGFTICAVAMRMQNDFMDALGLSFKNTALIYCIPYIISISVGARTCADCRLWRGQMPHNLLHLPKHNPQYLRACKPLSQRAHRRQRTTHSPTLSRQCCTSTTSVVSCASRWIARA